MHAMPETHRAYTQTDAHIHDVHVLKNERKTAEIPKKTGIVK